MVIEMKNVNYTIVATTYTDSGVVVHRSKKLVSEEIDLLMAQNTIRNSDTYSLQKENNGVVLYPKHMFAITIFEFVVTS